MQFYLIDGVIDPTGYYDAPFTDNISNDPVALYAPNGFTLTELEIALVKANRGEFYQPDDFSQRKDWIGQTDTPREGVVMNHSHILYRRAYSGEALQQLLKLADDNPTIHRVIQQRPRWGLDFCVEWIDRSGNVFEILHWEYDTFNYEEIEELRQRYEEKFMTTDWEAGARYLLAKKSEWHGLGWIPQSTYKCNYFGVIPENFGQVPWK
jgi:hypothetical protein